MEASVNIPADRRTNWSMVLRVGIVAVLILGLVGYAMKVTYESVIKGGVLDRGSFFEVDLQSMSNFNIDEKLGSIEDVPKRFRDLDRKKVQLEGEVAPVGNTAGPQVNQFSICFSIARCCIGGPPKPQHIVACKTVGGKMVTNYLNSRVRVFGTLHVNVVKEGGIISKVYELDVESVEPIS